ncbi:glycosyltransferase family 1 protein [Oceanihabitans sp. IOP_32]|uniref:DUF1972 domain-containing protein n=1 Tax=Oceanihabitans sp. IOP_32 TaxID=2529032 RepID=UPI001293FACA|nr:DUF1972 domain-containing protein [Oceanihabitans sp. IOP_32]QFZ54429.1 glycosyltransferase family 1 protein [Oceanihabitans sp. IOP_32]
MKLAILGTRGIPNNHGGFEQFAEYFSLYMANKGHDISVFNSHTHPYQLKEWNGVKIIHKNDPEDKIGTAGQFIYDLNCIRHCRKEHFDIILQLGYTSSSIWSKLLPKNSIIITNMDGLEWKRSKYKKPVRKFLKIAESLAVKNSDYLVSDSIGIQNYIKKVYNKESKYIAYGADVFNMPDKSVVEQYNVEPYKYNMLIARLEPENNIETILDGVSLAKQKEIILVIGKHDTSKFGSHLKNKYQNQENIKFVGGVYNMNHLNNLRYYSKFYFHGHSVGGTNPSLLEAMASGALIVANDNIFNKSILKLNALYFKEPKNISNIIDDNSFFEKNKEAFKNNNIKEIKLNFNWNLINSQYENYLFSKLKGNNG